MRVLFWYCDRFDWKPAMKTLDQAPDAEPAENADSVVAFVHVEPGDTVEGSSAETKLVKNTKWLARKWKTKQVILHSFSHLGEDKADPDMARALLERAGVRLADSGYQAHQTPYGYFNDLIIEAPGHPLARIYKAF
jgi:hypothetical protein